MNTEEEWRTFVLDLTEEAGSESEWVCIVEFGKQFLIERPALLWEVIFRRSQRISAEGNQAHAIERLLRKVGMEVISAQATKEQS